MGSATSVQTVDAAHFAALRTEYDSNKDKLTDQGNYWSHTWWALNFLFSELFDHMLKTYNSTAAPAAPVAVVSNDTAVVSAKDGDVAQTPA